jgi:beta-glucosidase
VRKLAFYDESAGRYVVDAGRYGLQVGSSSADSDVRLDASVSISGTVRPRPAVVNVKPIQTGDRENQVQQRVFFDVNTTIDPQLTVSMNDESRYGYITKGQSTPLPAGLSVRYTSNRPRIVRVSGSGTIRAVRSGVATITATVCYHGATASTSFVVNVAPPAAPTTP